MYIVINPFNVLAATGHTHKHIHVHARVSGTPVVPMHTVGSAYARRGRAFHLFARQAGSGQRYIVGFLYTVDCGRAARWPARQL